MNTVSQTAAAAVAFSRWPALFALGFGLLVVFGAGFAGPAAIHNAAHDTRHAFGLPCH